MVGVSRSSWRRWSQISGLLLGVERAVEACARLDVQARRPHERTLAGDAAERFDARLRDLETRLDTQLDALTAERLRADLATKTARRGV